MSSVLSKYETFMEVAKTNNMSRAAQNTHQTVPGVSYTIAKLEEEWEMPLFVRNRGKIALSEAGEALMPYISDVLEAQRRLEEEVQAYKSADKGTVRVGGLRRVTKRWLPGIVKEMEEKYPNIQIEIVLNPYEEVPDDLMEGVLDLAFAGEPKTKMLDFYHIIDDPYVVVFAKDHPMSSKTQLCIEDLRKEKLIMPNWSADQELQELMQKSNLDSQIKYRIKDTGTIVSMVESDMGISILPYFIVAGERAEVVPVRLSDWPAKRFGIVTAERERLSPSARKFMACAMEWLKEHKEEIRYQEQSGQEEG